MVLLNNKILFIIQLNYLNFYNFYNSLWNFMYFILLLVNIAKYKENVSILKRFNDKSIRFVLLKKIAL